MGLTKVQLSIMSFWTDSRRCLSTLMVITLEVVSPTKNQPVRMALTSLNSNTTRIKCRWATTSVISLARNQLRRTRCRPSDRCPKTPNPLLITKRSADKMEQIFMATAVMQTDLRVLRSYMILTTRNRLTLPPSTRVPNETRVVSERN